MQNEQLMTEGKKYCLNVYNRLPIAMVKGEGAYIYDADGNKYLDFVAGIAVNALGHSHPKVVEAIAKQAAKMIHCSNLYWIEPQIQLAKLLVENSAFDKVFFGNSGAEANEGAIKLSRKYVKTHGKPESFEIVTMKKSFHGRTMATLTATGQDKIRQGFDPLLPGFKYVEYNNIDALKEAITPTVCGVMLEPIQGEGGVIAADKEYLQAVRNLCDENGLLLIFDEVQVGMGRTGKLFAYQNYDVVPDIMTLAKALGGGTPIGAFLTTDKVAEALVPGDHGSTFGGGPLVTAAGVATLTTMLEDKVVENAAAMGVYLKEKLEELCQKHEICLEIRGLGLILGMQLVGSGKNIVAECLKQGLLINCTSETVLRFIPPLIITKKEVDEAIAILDDVLSKNQ